MNLETQYKQRKILTVVQIIALVIGLVLAVIDLPYPSLGELLGGFLILPIALAGLLRLGVRTYQIVSIKLGRKVYDEAGNCLTVSRPGLGVVMGIASPFILAGVLGIFEGVSMILVNVILVALLLVEVLLFILDVKYLKTAKQD
ncbi:MAG: hypothetical protein ACI4O5_08305 [Oscillospiraceae bacterium]